jgi:hypothetical protein
MPTFRMKPPTERLNNSQSGSETEQERRRIMTRIITVEPCGKDWRVRSDRLDGDMIFHSGAVAEAAARLLADAMAKAGQSGEVQIHPRDGSLTGRLPFSSSASTPGRASAPRTPTLPV